MQLPENTAAADLCGDSDIKEIGWIDWRLLEAQIGRACMRLQASVSAHGMEMRHA